MHEYQYGEFVCGYLGGLRLYLRIEAVSCRLLLRDGKGAHELNLEKKLGHFFFQALMLCPAKNTKKVLWLLLSVKICLISSS